MTTRTATAGAAPAPAQHAAPQRPWRRISLSVVAVEKQPPKLFTINKGPYTLRVDVAVTAAVLRRAGWLAVAALAAAYPQLWKLAQQLLAAFN